MSIKISRILHAGAVFESEGTKLLFDPLFENPFSRNCYAFPPVQFDLEKISQQTFSAVFISHYHDDHLSFESLQYLKRETPLFMYGLTDEWSNLLRELGFENIFPLKTNSSVNVGPFTVTPRLALDEDVDSIFEIKTSDVSILNVVDSWVHPDALPLLKKTKWDLVLWPFQTMREIEVLSPTRFSFGPPEIPVETIEVLHELDIKTLVPSSCQFRFEENSWLNDVFFPISYQEFETTMKENLKEIEILRLEPSQSFEILPDQIKPAGNLDWVQNLSPQLLDYHYKAKRAVPSTAEVSKMFAPLSAEEEKSVTFFCEHTLLKSFTNFSTLYFETPRVWELKVYNSSGLAQTFFYQIQNSKIKRLPSPDGPVGWLTEIPAARLKGALFEGESLTSLYIRVNDVRFDEKTETELASADPMEDPLLHALYSGKTASYQKAQLRKILRTSKSEKLL